VFYYGLRKAKVEATLAEGKHLQVSDFEVGVVWSFLTSYGYADL
jgi:hypothetical protein